MSKLFDDRARTPNFGPVPSRETKDIFKEQKADNLRINSSNILPKSVKANHLAIEVFEAIYPIGSVYINASDSTNPATLLGLGTWEAWGVGKVIVGIDTTQTEFDTAGETGGSKTHTLTTAEMPTHNHTIADWLMNGAGASGAHYGYGYQTNTGALIDRDSYSTSGEVQGGAKNTGGGGSHNNLQPYQVGYVWKRTA